MEEAFEVATSSPLFRVTGIWSTFSKTVLAFFISWMSASFTNRRNLSNSVFIVYWPLDFLRFGVSSEDVVIIFFGLFNSRPLLDIFECLFFSLSFSLFLLLLSPYLNDFNQLQIMHLFNAITVLKKLEVILYKECPFISD